MPPWFTPDLLYDPDGKWASRASGPDTLLVTGMRGCGKTMLLRSLEWTARIHPRMVRSERESSAQVRARVSDEDYLGLFVSCSALLGGERRAAEASPAYSLFLAFAREAVTNAEVTQNSGIDQVAPGALDEFVRRLEPVVPALGRADGFLTLGSIDRLLGEAARSAKAQGVPEFSPYQAFEDLARATRGLLQVWSMKRVLFILDDLTRRFVDDRTIEDLLTTLSMSSPLFSFKVSTESQTLLPRTTGGLQAQEGRDYRTFDLGAEVFRELLARGPAFLERVLLQRIQAVDTPGLRTPRELLGDGRGLQELAKDIIAGKDIVYFGLDALAALCVGDLSDVIQLYQRMAMSAEPWDALPLKASVQHDIILDVSAQKMRSLGVTSLDADWLHDHANSFSTASSRELLSSREQDRPRTYNLLHMEVPVGGDAEIYRYLNRLLEEGVFVLTGVNDRSKRPGSRRSLQLKLAFRNLLGVAHRIPLGKRDRFEHRTVFETTQWLREPAPELLRFGRIKSGPKAERHSGEVISQPARQDFLPLGEAIALPPARSSHTVEVRSVSSVELSREARPIVIGGLGYEDRSVTSWMRLLELDPALVIALKYPVRGFQDEIFEIMGSVGVEPVVIAAESATFPESELWEMLERAAKGATVIVDITSLSKVILFELVSRLIRGGFDLTLAYTEAESYWPPEVQLDRLHSVVSEHRSLAVSEVDKLLLTDRSSFRLRVVEDNRGSLGEAVLVAPVPINHRRVQDVLDVWPVSSVVAIVPFGLEGGDPRRGDICSAFADYYVDRYGGRKVVLGGLDLGEAFSAIEALHAQFALQVGLGFEVLLSGNKVQTAAAALLAGITSLSAVVYPEPAGGHLRGHVAEGAAGSHYWSVSKKLGGE